MKHLILLLSFIVAIACMAAEVKDYKEIAAHHFSLRLCKRDLCECADRIAELENILKKEGVEYESISQPD